ncbi:MAG: LytTR family DNA-binding domain-containing protein [Bacteroidota bacterium]
MRLLIVEDEFRIAKRLERIARDYFSTHLRACHHFETIHEALSFLQQSAIDLMLLDLNLHGQDGFELLKRFSAAAFHVIIISAYHDKALQAFEYGVLDFVPKPFSSPRLFKAFDRLQENNPRNNQPLKYLSVQQRGSLRLIPIADLSYIQGAGSYSVLVLKTGNRPLHNKGLEQLEKLLPEPFQRIHKSYLIDLRQLKCIRIEGGGKYVAELKGGEELPVGRTRYSKLKAKGFF